MLRILSSIGCFLRLGPRQYIRQKFKIPLVKFIHDTIDLYKSRTKAGVNNVREILFRGTVVALITALLVWLSILMYVAFYYVYVPAISHERPVFLKFKPCGATDNCIAEKGICSFPSAHVQLTERQQLLMIGQPYKIHLDLEMPESPKNRELGMFMVCVEFIGKDGTLVEHSCRSTMLHYRGILLDTLYKLVFSPFFLFGSAEEKQTVQVELFSNFEDNDYEPVTDIFVEVQSRFIEIYSAKFSVNAQFAGLRYIMFHWPVLSAALGITANLFFIALVCLISWYQILHSEEYLEFMESSRIKQRESENWIEGDNMMSLLNIGTLTFMPVLIGYDVCTYSFAKVFNIISIPTRIVRYIIRLGHEHYIDALEVTRINNVSTVNQEETKCGNCNRIICAKHRKSGCEKCLANSELVFLT